MKYTQQQFEEILNGDKAIYLDDLPFEPQGLEFFNLLPDSLQSSAHRWGTNDTGFREDLFKFLIKNQFSILTTEYYYHSDIFDRYKKTRENLLIDYSKLGGKKIEEEEDEDEDEEKEEVYNEKVILFNKSYHGFEDMFDLDRDISELMDFDNKEKIPPEFTGTVKVIIEYYPSIEDKIEIENL